MDFLFNEDGLIVNLEEVAKYNAIDIGLYKQTAKITREGYKKGYCTTWRDKICYVHNQLTDLVMQQCNVSETMANKMITKALNINNAQHMRRKRAKIRMFDICDNNMPVWFITITFTDKTLQTTSRETRRKLVARYFKSLGDLYFANIDFGKRTHREHYHGCVCSLKEFKASKLIKGVMHYKPVDMPFSYGFIDALKVNTNCEDNNKITEYIMKLTNHSLKQSKSLNAPRLIYSRNFLPF